MATPNAVLSIRNLLIALLVVGSFTTACKKSGGSGSDVDPRDQYVGTYDGGDRGYQSVITLGTLALNPEYGATTVVVTKSANPNEIYIEAPSQSLKVTAELTGSTFTVIDKTSGQIFVPPTNTYTGAYKATGVFGKDQASGKNAFVLTATTELLKDGTTIKRVETYNGTLK